MIKIQKQQSGGQIIIDKINKNYNIGDERINHCVCVGLNEKLKYFNRHTTNLKQLRYLINDVKICTINFQVLDLLRCEGR